MANITDSRLPDFLICGAQRGGTTALYHYLRSHPQVYMPGKKELHFFDQNYHRGLKWYSRFFKQTCRDGCIVGEATPSYMYLEEVPQRIKRVLPDVKLIFVLRHPVDRAYSHYWLEVRLGLEPLSFEEALLKEPRRLATGSLFNRIHYSYIDRGRYAAQLERFLKLFPRRNIFVATHRELRSNPADLLARISRFLGIDHRYWENHAFTRGYNVGRSPRSWGIHRAGVTIARRLGHSPPGILLRLGLMLLNTKRGYPPMRSGTRRMLLNHYKAWNKKLEKMLGLELDWWYR